jgi:hypothetical protein
MSMVFYLERIIQVKSEKVPKRKDISNAFLRGES